MAENKLADLSIDFAVKILKLTDGMKGHYSLLNQLERRATSLGANIREAKYAQSKADFISKLKIACPTKRIEPQQHRTLAFGLIFVCILV